MNLLRRLLVVLVLAGTTLVFSAARPAWACSCGVNDDPLSAAEVAFTGVATDVDGPLVDIATSTTVTVTFDVESADKGDVGPRTEVTTSSQGPACGYPFTEGHRYRVYANDGETNSCDGNQDLGFVAAPDSAVPTALWTTAAAAVAVAASTVGYLWFRRRRANDA